MSSLSTDLNVNPYFDDFDEDKDFYRILFRPRIPVQARELSQLQTAIQKQIQRFGDHVFKDGSVVEGCHVTYLSDFNYVSVADSFFSNNDLTISSIDNSYLLVGNTSGVRAVVLKSVDGFEASFPSSNRFYVNYIYTGNSFSTFQRGEYIRVYDDSQSKLDVLNEGNYVDQILVLNELAATGNGYGVSVGDGVIYHKGYFERVESQTIVIKEFDSNPSGYRVGFDTTEEIITEDQDTTLNDNALGYPNFNAPGAHRLKLTPTLVKKLRTDDSDSTNFFAIIEFDGSSPTEQHIDPTYNALGDEFAIRTYEESGDYVVKPFSIETFPGINANSNLEDANLFAYSISTGTAFVKGYRVEKIGTSNVVVSRAFTEKLSEAQIITANYGNFVVVSEVMGHFNWKAFSQVTLYDAAQSTITDQEKASGARAGNIVGFANVRDVDYYSGTKGVASCQYIVYLDNIRMNSGKSFSSDVKSIYVSSGYGDARADVVLANNYYSNGTPYTRAELVDSSYKTLVFPVGTGAVKSFNNNVGASDTQFVFRDVANGTLQTNGYISITTNPAGPGGTERINASGTLTSLNEKSEFDLILTTDVFTTNLVGTVSVNTTTTNVIGTTTAFSTHFTSGAYIRVGTDSRRINVITNATHMTVASAFSVTNASANYSRHYLEGTHVDLSSVSANVVITSNTTLAINTTMNLNVSLNATSTAMVSYPILKAGALPIKKDVYKSRWVKIDCSNNSANSVGPWTLGLPDVYDIEAVYVGTTYSNTNTNGVSWFSLDTGQRDSTYELAKLQVKPQYSTNITGASKLLVKLSHFTANASGGVGFYSVDSYPTSNTANATTIAWGEIPTFRTSSGVFLDLRESVDFRPQKANTAVSTTTEASATINPANVSANAFVSGTFGYTPAPDSNFQADVTYYLPRRDLITVNKNGDFAVVQGEPAVYPVSPFVDNDVMLVASAYVPAWPSLTTREAADYGRHDIQIRHDVKTNRRYTMRDIGSIDQRLKRMEYYTVLNSIEQKARDFTIPDVNGLDRFKNGIFADPFNSHALGKVDDFEYKISIDSDESVARPFFKKNQVDFVYSVNTSTTQKTGNYVTSPYTHETYIVQSYASKIRNCTESIWAWNGKMSLYPSYDDHRDETSMPNVNVNIDLSSAFEDFANSPFGTQFGEWRTTNTSVRSTGTAVGVDTTTTSLQRQIISQMQVDTMTSTYNLGNFVKDVAIEPYMRSRTVAFIATNLKPNTVMHAFFDNVNVDASCAPAELSANNTAEVGREDRILDRTGAYGSTLRTSSTGTIRGIFRIPEATFRVGDRNFMLTDVADIVTGVDASLTRADARFSASNITLSTQGLTLNTIEPELNFVQSVNTRSVSVTSTVLRPVAAEATRSQGRGEDPIAQSFFAMTPTDVSGSFITKVDLFFERKDPSVGVTLLVCEMRLGKPDTSRILGKCHLESAEVSVSADAATATTFTFNNPIFLNSGDVYAFLVKPDGDSPEYRIWMGETGGYDVASGVQIYQNPYSGVAFVSSNMNSWTELQKEDIKFTMYRANFTVGSSLAFFNNENDEYISFTGLIRANTSTTVQVGDICYTANATTTLTGANTSQPYGVVQYIDEAEETVYIDSSTGGWAAAQKLQFHRPSAVGNTTLINANSLLANVTISSVDNLNYHMVVPRFSTMIPGRTLLLYGYKGTSNVGTLDTSYISVTNDVEYEFLDTTRVARSYSNEAGSKSSRYQVTFVTESPYVSPVIDLRRKSSLLIENLINNDATGEANTRYGAAVTKYVSRNVILDDGQESEDIHVWVSGYRPVGTSIKVYVKFHNAEDGESFDSKAWTELQAGVGEFNYSSSIDKRDFIEYEYTVPTTAPATNPTAGAVSEATGIIRYTRADGAVFESYKTFSLKIVLLSSEPALVPKLNDVRAICLQA